MGDWPVAYRIITVYANGDISDYQERHGAIIHRRQVMQWLDGTIPEVDILAMQPTHTFVVEELGKGERKERRQGQLAF